MFESRKVIYANGAPPKPQTDRPVSSLLSSRLPFLSILSLIYRLSLSSLVSSLPSAARPKQHTSLGAFTHELVHRADFECLAWAAVLSLLGGTAWAASTSLVATVAVARLCGISAPLSMVLSQRSVTSPFGAAARSD